MYANTSATSFIVFLAAERAYARTSAEDTAALAASAARSLKTAKGRLSLDAQLPPSSFRWCSAPSHRTLIAFSRPKINRSCAAIKRATSCVPTTSDSTAASPVAALAFASTTVVDTTVLPAEVVGYAHTAAAETSATTAREAEVAQSMTKVHLAAARLP